MKQAQIRPWEKTKDQANEAMTPGTPPTDAPMPARMPMKPKIRNTQPRAMRYVFSLGLLLAGAVLATPARAANVSNPAGWSLGLMLGSPTGLTAKKYMGGANAWDVALGLGGFGQSPGFRLHGDYLWGLAQVIPDTTDVTLDLYLGVGPLVGVGHNGWCRSRYYRNDYYDCGDYNNVYIGGRVPFGIDLRFKKAPVSLGVEIAPGIVANQYYVSGELEGFLFVRYLFGQNQ